MVLRVTHTYAILDVSPACYQEIKDKLIDAGYLEHLHREVDYELVVMEGLALRQQD